MTPGAAHEGREGAAAANGQHFPTDRLLPTTPIATSRDTRRKYAQQAVYASADRMGHLRMSHPQRAHSTQNTRPTRAFKETAAHQPQETSAPSSIHLHFHPSLLPRPACRPSPARAGLCGGRSTGSRREHAALVSAARSPGALR